MVSCADVTVIEEFLETQHKLIWGKFYLPEQVLAIAVWQSKSNRAIGYIILPGCAVGCSTWIYIRTLHDVIKMIKKNHLTKHISEYNTMIM
jgi:hypothetical protein